LLAIPELDQPEEGGNQGDFEPVMQAENRPQKLGFTAQPAGIVIDRRQREIDNNVMVPIIEERKGHELGERREEEPVNQDRDEQQRPLIEIDQAGPAQIDELDEDLIDQLLETVHDSPDLQPDERTRIEYANKFVVRSHHQQTRGLFQKAKKTGEPVHFHDDQ